ncbi:hypothetical protein T4B_7489 [Trichinella pseudospiralis]|uniref:Uncharacterized protein n=1 Tax=Trichinella pseudospiralis TaxID=6337 RepID=A0A0V1GQ43_TRIPS|nr:hypothetical protein T4B_7489 [Trichinella pseudospiralis]
MLVGVRCAVLVNWRFPEVFGETEIQDLQEGCKSIHFTYKVHLAVRFNAPKKDTLRCVIISKGALVCLTYVASGSVAKRSLILFIITQKCSTFLLVSLLLKTVYTNVLIIIFVVTLLCDTVGKVKLMKQKKVKARMTPSKSWTTLRRKIDEKRHAEGCFD